jgi:hypothetical protein
VIENWVLRQIVELKRDKVTGVWKRLHEEENYDRYCSANTMICTAQQTLFERSTAL